MQRLEVRMTVSDAIHLVFLGIVLWLAVNIDSGGGGGKRARVPALG